MQVNVSLSGSLVANMTFAPWPYNRIGDSPGALTVSNGVNGTAWIYNVTYNSVYQFGTNWAQLQQRWCLAAQTSNFSDPGWHPCLHAQPSLSTAQCLQRLRAGRLHGADLSIWWRSKPDRHQSEQPAELPGRVCQQLQCLLRRALWSLHTGSNLPVLHANRIWLLGPPEFVAMRVYARLIHAGLGRVRV